MENKPLEPKLRFPEFRDAPGWEMRLLQDMLREHGRKSDGASEVHSVSVHKGIVNQVDHLGRSFAAADTSHYNLVLPGDIVYTKSPTGDFPYGIVKQSKLRKPVIVSPLYGVFTPETEHLGAILDAYFESEIRTNNYLAPITQKGAKNTIQISNTTFLSGGLFLPVDPAEQRKIAECLTSLDELIAAEGRRLEALRDHKKALLQNLFPRPERTENGKQLPAETTPRLRFPEFRTAGEWAWKPLGKVLTEHKRMSTGLETVHSVSVSFGLVDQVQHLGRSYAAADTSRYNLVMPSDVVFTKSPTGQFPFGIVKQSRLQYTAIVSPLYGVFSPVHTSFGHLIEAFFESPERAASFLAPIARKGAKNTIQITNGTFLSGRVPLPTEVKEADIIASILGSVDDLITAQSQKLDTLKTHKQGLMQSLFPTQRRKPSDPR